MSTQPALVLLPISPWSEQVRWAFDHHGIVYRTIEHVPVMGERRLRRLVGDRVRPATVPVLLDGETAVADSWAIVKHADAIGAGASLIPGEREEEIRRWHAVADASMQAGRALVVSALLASPAGLDETLPHEVPQWLRPALRPVNRAGTRWFARKYGVQLDALERYAEKLRAGLDALRAALAGGEYLVGSFSYADIAMATVLQGVEPVADRYLRLGPATRAVWTRAELAREYADLLRWRDELYARHRERAG